MNPTKGVLAELRDALRKYGEQRSAELISAALSGDQPALASFLRSNELWGGSGSIADQACISGSREARREIEAIMVKLGAEQMAAGAVNERTEAWVAAFEAWARKGL